jgi:FixJ family two-component response regulator
LNTLESVRFLLAVIGHPVEIFASAAEFLNDMWYRFACLILYHIPHMNDWEPAERLRAEGARISILLIIGSPSSAIVARASKLRIERVLETPPGHQDLLDFINATRP